MELRAVDLSGTRMVMGHEYPPNLEPQFLRVYERHRDRTEEHSNIGSIYGYNIFGACPLKHHERRGGIIWEDEIVEMQMDEMSSTGGTQFRE